jgi:hypothetical protein
VTRATRVRRTPQELVPSIPTTCTERRHECQDVAVADRRGRELTITEVARGVIAMTATWFVSA